MLLYYGYSIFFVELIIFEVLIVILSEKLGVSFCDKKSMNYNIKITQNRNNTWFVDCKEVFKVNLVLLLETRMVAPISIGK